VHTMRAPAAALVAQLVLLGALLWAGGADLAGASVGVTCAVLGWAVLARALEEHGRQGLGPADHVTVTRGTLACVVAALTIDSAVASSPTTSLVLLATVALTLDAVDGWVARRTRTTTALGARMDMEVDAFLILVLSIAAAGVLGWWVLAIGAFRYVLVVATWAVPWLGSAVPPRYWRKAIAALQGIVLTLAVARVLPDRAAAATVMVALALLAWSFGTQGVELWRARGARSDAPEERHAGAVQRTGSADVDPGAQPVRSLP
jgi:phosphatidylglycerophosphate synthase